MCPHHVAEPQPSTLSPGPRACSVPPPFPCGWFPWEPCVSHAGSVGSRAQAPCGHGPGYPLEPCCMGVGGTCLTPTLPWELVERLWSMPPTPVLTFLLDLPLLLRLVGFRLSAYLPADSRMLRAPLMLRESCQERDGRGQEAAGKARGHPQESGSREASGLNKPMGLPTCIQGAGMGCAPLTYKPQVCTCPWQHPTRDPPGSSAPGELEGRAEKTEVC